MSRRLLLSTLFAATAWCASASSLHAQLTIEELELYIAPSTGSDNGRTFRVRNDADRIVQASVAIEDWDRAEDGVNRFYEAGTQANSCASKLTVFPRSLRLEPGASANVRVSIADAGARTSSCWSIVFVESKQAPDSIGRQLTYTVRTGVKIYVEPNGLARDGEIEELTLVNHVKTAATDSATRDIRIAFRNSGGVQLRVKSAIEVRRLDNSLVQRIDVPMFPVLPAVRRVVTSALPVLPKGRYVILALLDFGGDEIAAGQIQYEVR
jgi:P pilus assembly chaperone PapD